MKPVQPTLNNSNNNNYTLHLNEILLDDDNDDVDFLILNP